jgi:hypothetical protein
MWTPEGGGVHDESAFDNALKPGECPGSQKWENPTVVRISGSRIRNRGTIKKVYCLSVFSADHHGHNRQKRNHSGEVMLRCSIKSVYGSNGITYGSNGITYGSNGITYGSNGIIYGSNELTWVRKLSADSSSTTKEAYSRQ